MAGVDARAVVGVVVLGMLGMPGMPGMLGCQSSKDQAPDAKTEPAPEHFEPLTKIPGHELSSDGRVRVPVPDSHGWECLEEQHGADAGAAVALRCRRENPREFLFLAAKTHRQPADQRTDAQTLLMSLYRADNERFFAKVEYLSDGPAALVGAQGWEAELEAEHAQLGTIRKRERVAIVGDRVYAISAEGNPEQWTRELDAIEEWFAKVEFAR